MNGRIITVFSILMACASAPTPPPETLIVEPQLPMFEPEPLEVEPTTLFAPDGVEMKPCLDDSLEGMRCIDGGPFIRGYDGTHKCDQYENIAQKTQYGPIDEIWLQTFYMDTTEVTFSAYQACVKDGQCPPAKPRYSDYSRSNQPMVGVSWYAANTYCLAQGKRLPTEAQWEKAARGTAGAQTPFGTDLVSCSNAVVKDNSGRSCGVKKEKGSHPEKGRTWEVGLMPAGEYQLYDMVGNAEEWVADWFSPSLEACGEACTGTDPLGPCNGAEKCSGHRLKMVKGGSWYWPAEHATAWHRRPHVPSNDPYHHFGFRCAANLTDAKKLLPQSE